MRGRSLEEPARGSGEVGADDMLAPPLLKSMSSLAWASLLGGGGRPFRTRNGGDSTERNPCFFPCPFPDIVVGGSLHEGF